MSERLTKRKEYGCACWNGDQNLVTHRRYSEMLEALAKYEDVIFDADGNEVIGLEELSQLLQDKREGRVVVLPNCMTCKNKMDKEAIYPSGVSVEYPCEGCYGLIKIKRFRVNRYEAERALAAAEPKGDAKT